MTFEIFLTDDALGDLEAIGYYIAAADSPQQADYVLGKIEEICAPFTCGWISGYDRRMPCA